MPKIIFTNDKLSEYAIAPILPNLFIPNIFYSFNSTDLARWKVSIKQEWDKLIGTFSHNIKKK